MLNPGSSALCDFAVLNEWGRGRNNKIKIATEKNPKIVHTLCLDISGPLVC